MARRRKRRGRRERATPSLLLRRLQSLALVAAELAGFVHPHVLRQGGRQAIPGLVVVDVRAVGGDVHPAELLQGDRVQHVLVIVVHKQPPEAAPEQHHAVAHHHCAVALAAAGQGGVVLVAVVQEGAGLAVEVVLEQVVELLLPVPPREGHELVVVHHHAVAGPHEQVAPHRGHLDLPPLVVGKAKLVEVLTAPPVRIAAAKHEHLSAVHHANVGRAAAWFVPSRVYHGPRCRLQVKGVHVREALVGIPAAALAPEHDHLVVVHDSGVAVAGAGGVRGGVDLGADPGLPVDPVHLVEPAPAVAPPEDHHAALMHHRAVEGPALGLVHQQRDLPPLLLLEVVAVEVIEVLALPLHVLVDSSPEVHRGGPVDGHGVADPALGYVPRAVDLLPPRPAVAVQGRGGVSHPARAAVHLLHFFEKRKGERTSTGLGTP
eukprot:RCo033007